MAHGLPLPEGRVEGDHDLSPSPLEKLRIVAFALLILTREGAMVVTLILLSQGRGEGVAMATPILLLEGRRQGDYGHCLHLILGSGGVFSNPRQGVGKVWLWPMAAIF